MARVQATVRAGGNRRPCGDGGGHHDGPLTTKRKTPGRTGGWSARYWDRTSDLFRVREARYRCANRAREGCSVVMRGGDGIRTRVNGFAGRCLAARPRHRVWFDPRVVIALESGDPRTRADDETRTRDPHLGKVMRYQLRYIRISFPVLPGHLENSSPFRAPRKTTATPRVSRSHGSNHPHGSGNIGTRPGRVAAPGAEGDWRSW